jgi:3',5'-cyclic AMP phosphodiesterase CpdA
MDSVRIAHISDLHFGGSDNQKDTWDALKQHLQHEARPDLVLVTGDVVNTPKTKLYEEARAALDDLCGGIAGKPEVPYFVCPGNHDRWRYGNAPFLAKAGGLRRWLAGPFRRRIIRASSEFDRIFLAKIPDLREPPDLTLGPIGNRWNLRILGIDSSIHADASARGFIEQGEIDELKTVMQNSDAIDLGVLLVHHHLFPVRSLEKRREGDFWDLADLTPLINAGSLVEALAAAHVDIALHGHEHASNWGSYSTLEAQGGETHVIGAGSGTGAVTLKPSEQKLASYNLFELRENRTIHLSIYGCDGKNWKPTSEFQVYDSQALRRARFLRRAQQHIYSKPISDVTRFIDFTRERDGIVSEIRTNLDFSAEPRLALQAQNSTGVPVDLKLSLTSEDNTKWEPEDDVTFNITNQLGTFDFECTVPESVAKTLQRLEFSYRWFNGAVLTREEIRALAPGTEGEFRSDGYEFGAIQVDGYFHTLRLIVRLPPEFAPAPNEVQGFVRNPQLALEDDVLDQPDVLDCFRPIGPGLYSMVVPYPRRGFVYGIRWQPPEAAATGALGDDGGRQFIDASKRDGANLARVFYRGLANTPLENRCSVALYTPLDQNPGVLGLAGSYPTNSSVPTSIATGRGAGLVSLAWRGMPMVVPEPPAPGTWWDPGLQQQEKALLAIPVRFGITWTNVAPWGVIRLGVNESSPELQALLAGADAPLLLNRLARPMILMLGEAGIGVG